MSQEVKDTGVSGTLQGTSGVLHLAAQTSAGALKLEAQQFISGADRTFIAHAQFDSRQLYRSVFSHDHDRLVFAHLRDDDHSTTIVLADTDNPDIGSLTVWNDAETPKHFRIDRVNFTKTRDQKGSILDGKAKHLDQVGKRNPVKITPVELYNIFGDHPAYRQFMLGLEPPIASYINKNNSGEGIVPQSGGTLNWCMWLCLIPACGITCLFWTPVGAG